MFNGVEATWEDVLGVYFNEVVGTMVEADCFEDYGEEEKLVEVGVVHF